MWLQWEMWRMNAGIETYFSKEYVWMKCLYWLKNIQRRLEFIFKDIFIQYFEISISDVLCNSELLKFVYYY